MRYAAILLLIPLLSPRLSAQVNAPSTIANAYVLEEHGRFAEAIALAKPLVDSGTLQGVELGRAWTVLGLTYTDQGAFNLAQHAFEKAIYILQSHPESIKDYAAALDNFGGLYHVMGQLEASTDLRLKTLHVYEQIGDHSGIARVCNNLASIALHQRNTRKGGNYLQRAAAEMKVATALDDEDIAAIYSMQAELASMQGNTQAAVTGYERAMQVWKRSHKEAYPNMGWGYMLLGHAHADAGRIDDARNEMQQGLSILSRTFGPTNPYYLEAEVVYSRLLDDTGDHNAAARLRTAAEANLKTLRQTQCVGCTISIDALR